MMPGWPDIISQTDSLVVYDPGSSSRDLVKGPIFVTFSGSFCDLQLWESIQVTLKKLGVCLYLMISIEQ